MRCERPGQDRLPRRRYYQGTNDRIYVVDSSDKERIEDADCQKTVEVHQVQLDH